MAFTWTQEEVDRLMMTGQCQMLPGYQFEIQTPNIKPWSQDEDVQILKFYSAIGPRWGTIANQLIDRTESMVKTRFYRYLSKKNPNDLLKLKVPAQEIKEEPDLQTTKINNICTPIPCEVKQQQQNPQIKQVKHQETQTDNIEFFCPRGFMEMFAQLMNNENLQNKPTELKWIPMPVMRLSQKIKKPKK